MRVNGATHLPWREDQTGNSGGGQGPSRVLAGNPGLQLPTGNRLRGRALGLATRMLTQAGVCGNGGDRPPHSVNSLLTAAGASPQTGVPQVPKWSLIPSPI